MRLLKPKETIVWDARQAALRAMQYHIPQSFPLNSTNSITSLIADLVSVGIEAGLREALNNVYTDEQFEQDLTLK